jgi:glycosyltransferase involved in cell wall biosynthesis
MKVLYLTVPSFFDLEISLIRELKKFVDVKVMMIVSPESMRLSAFAMEKLERRCDIIPAIEYQGMNKYSEMIDLNDWFIANNPDNSIFHSILLAHKIHKFYIQNDFTHLHSTTDCKTAIMYLPYAWMTRNTLYTVHDPISHKKLSFLNDLFRYKFTFKSYKNLLLLSDSLLMPFCKRYRIARKNVYFSRLSVYDFLQCYKETPNDLGEYILFFGNIVPYKGVDNLIDAYLQSDERKRGTKLVIAGKGNILHDEKSLSDDIILKKKYIDNDELANLIHHCKYVVLPYISATQSGCVMSAYAFNKPVVATRVGDLPKEVEDGWTGIICMPNDVKSLQIAIDKMAETDLDAMSLNIKSKYANDGPYSWNAAAQSIANTYINIGG